MNVRFVSGVSPIVESASSARRFYGEQLGLPVQAEPDSDYTEVTMDGLKHFGLWTLHDAARSTFERDEWPPDVQQPQATIELEVDDVPAAVGELRERGLEVLQDLQRIEAGAEMLRDDRHPMVFLAREIAKYHHAHWDGNGHPERVGGTFIPLAARICAIADAYDAMTHDRPYKQGIPAGEAREVIESERGAHFDPQVVDAFVKVFPDLPAALA